MEQDREKEAGHGGNNEIKKCRETTGNKNRPTGNPENRKGCGIRLLWFESHFLHQLHDLGQVMYSLNWFPLKKKEIKMLSTSHGNMMTK